MIFFANSLPMNGGSTFLIRISRELKRRGVAVVVLLLRREYDAELLSELEKNARILYLDEFLLDGGVFFRRHLAIFGFIAWKKLRRVLQPFGSHVHVMGLLGLFFASRASSIFSDIKVTAGVYHQNEFLYSGVNFYFAKKMAAIFCDMPALNVVFYNEVSRDNYQKFFQKDFSCSFILPIGVELPDDKVNAFCDDVFRIVSVGNLVEFKTYNEHMIKALPGLLAHYPDVIYEVYGVGSNADHLKILSAELNLSDRVIFHGEIEYSKMSDVLNGVALFVGSGTALIEAAARGIPALIGIESIKTSQTYGFLSDAHGFSYNENVPSIPKKSIKRLLDEFFSDGQLRRKLSILCREKSKDFSVQRTADGLLSLPLEKQGGKCLIGVFVLLRMFISFTNIFVYEKLSKNKCFSGRRNQSH